MIRSLVNKLPFMLTPSWTRQQAQPIAIEDIIEYLVESAEHHFESSEIFEIGGLDQISYLGLMQEYAKKRNLKRIMISMAFKPLAWYCHSSLHKSWTETNRKVSKLILL